MTSVRTVPPLAVTEWPVDLDHIRDDMNGDPIHVHRLMAHSPELLKAWWPFRNFSVQGGTLGSILGELVILRVGVHLGAWYEWASHVDRALQAGLTLEQINALLLRRLPNDWNEAHIAVVHAVDDLMDHHRLSVPVRAELETHLDTAQIMDLIAIHGMYVILGCMIHTWDLALDDKVAARIDGLTDRATFEKAAQRFHET